MAELKRETRSRELSVTFTNGYADGWAFLVGDCFREALDIRWTPVMVDGQDDPVNMWTEGKPPLYQFERGDFIHHRDGRLSVQVQGHQPDTFAGGERCDGRVMVKIIRRGRASTSVEMTQCEFVRRLQSGDF